MDEVAISVIMPVYNEEKYLPTALDSLSKQTMRNFELICVDDGSMDGSVGILERYRDKFPFMTIIRQKNQYAGVARNNGMWVARGKYLLFLDSDDYFRENMLEEVYLCAENEKADVVIYDGEFFEDCIEKGAYGRALKTQYIKEGLSVLDDDAKDKYLFNIAGAWPWNKLFLREFIVNNKLEFQAQKRANDIYFVALALAFAHRIAIVEKKLIAYRIGNPESLIATRDETPLASAEAFLDVKKVLEQKGLYEKYKRSFQNFVLFVCIRQLNAFKTEKGFCELYKAFQDWMIDEFDFDDLGENDYLPAAYYAQIQCMKENTAPIDFLLETNREMLKCRIAVEEKKKELSETRNKIQELKRDLAAVVRKVKEEEQKFVFPFGRVPRGCNIVLYAAGKVGKCFYSQVKKTNYCNVTAWVDAKAEEKKDKRISVPCKEIFQECDLIIVSVMDGGLAESIRTELAEQYEVPGEKVIWLNPYLEE